MPVKEEKIDRPRSSCRRQKLVDDTTKANNIVSEVDKLPDGIWKRGTRLADVSVWAHPYPGSWLKE